MLQALGQGQVFHSGHVLLRKIRPGGQVRSQAGELLPDGPHPLGQGPAAAGLGLPGGLLAPRADELHHRLCLGQVHLPVEEGPAGELPRLGRGGPGGQHLLEQTPGEVQPPVAGELHHVLPGVAFGGGEYQGHHVVQLFPGGGVRPAQGGGIAPHLGDLPPVPAPEHPVRHGPGLRPGDAHNADAPRRRPGGDGGDGPLALWHSLFPPYRKGGRPADALLQSPYFLASIFP